MIDLLSIIKGNKSRENRVLFIENGNSFLTEDLNLVKNLLLDSKIEFNILFPLDEIPSKIINRYLDEYDVIIFQTTWISEISKSLIKVMDSYSKKVVIDVILYEPKFYTNPSKVHDWYNLDVKRKEIDNWLLTKLI